MQTNYNAFADKVETIAETVILGIDPSIALTDKHTLDVTFYAGTLFVECGAHTAAKIKTALIEGMECGVCMSKVGHEFAFDFTE
jgi:hypothetical protein